MTSNEQSKTTVDRVGSYRRAARIAAMIAAGCAVYGGTERSAMALQGGEDPATLPVLVDKRFGAKSRHQTSLLFTTSMVTKFVEAVGVYAAYQYSFSDLLGLELSGGYFFGSETNIMREVRENFPGQEPPLSDLYQMQWNANLDVVFVPLYGKMSFASEFDPSFDLFFVAGAGVLGTQRDQTDGPTVSNVGPAFNLGAGLRFYLLPVGGGNLALRLEFRDYFYPDPAPDVGGLTWNLHLQAGLQLTFGGDK